MDSRTGAFMDSYNKSFSEFASGIAASYFKRVQMDMELVKDRSSGILQNKIRQIDDIINDRSGAEDDYAKVKIIGLILQDIAMDLISDADAGIRKSGVNILNGFLDVVRRTGDNELLKIALAIRESADVVSQKRKEAAVAA